MRREREEKRNLLAGRALLRWEGESRGRGLRKPLKSIGKKSQVLRREAKGIKTPLKGSPS